MNRLSRRIPTLARLTSLSLLLAAPTSAWAYHPINPTHADHTITLTGRSLTIDDVVEVARHGAAVALGQDAEREQADHYGLLLEAAAEGIPVYWFNRGSGDQRETVIFDGDALAPANRALVEQLQLGSFRQGARLGVGPEIDEEEIVRAMMVVRANTMIHNAPSPALARMLVQFLNRRITPVVQSRGTLGEGDLAQLGNVGGTMVGVGEAYLNGQRLSAIEALHRAGLEPLQPFAADDNALTSSNAYAAGQAALLVHDAERALDWGDVSYAMALDGMNSSVTPLSLVVQRDRPNAWLNWHAARTLAMLRGSYLFDADPARIIQDPESLRASSIRQASAWMEWALLRDAVAFQINTSDHNPAIAVDVEPSDSWELATPQMMRFYVRGGGLSHGHHGYILSNANWDPYPLANRIESFTIALANMDVAVMLRIERFRNTFFTGVAADDVIKGIGRDEDIYAPVDLGQEIQTLTNPVAPLGSAIVGTVEDLQAQTRLKVQRARAAVNLTIDLLGLDVMQNVLWMDVRAAQSPGRQFGPAPTRAREALRTVLPAPGASAPDGKRDSGQPAVANFLRTHPAAVYAEGGPSRPDRTPSGR